MITSIIVPTYNERDNIEILVSRLSQVMDRREYEIIIVDDNSPDGTAEIGRILSEQYPVRVIERLGKYGLGSAVMEGFKQANGDILGIIDADLQHPPELVPKLCDEVANGNDIAVASRYVRGGSVEDWSLIRKVISLGATSLARPLTRVKDPMSGFFFLKKGLVDNVSLSSSGYKILLEILVKRKPQRVAEVPYQFRKRTAGASKLDRGEYLRYLQLLGRLYLSRLFMK